jgi:hypothetical protein
VLASTRNGSRIASLEGRVTDLETSNTTLQGQIESLEALLAGVTRDNTTLKFTGMDLQIVNAADSTATTNGLGNLIIGYNAQRAGATRTGSHYLVVGDEHEWTSYGGILAGNRNTASGYTSPILGGQERTVATDYACHPNGN